MTVSYSRKEIIGDSVLYLGDCLDILPTLGKVDCVVTSPPYAQQRDYGKKITDWRSLVSGALTSVSDNAQVLCNLGLIYRGGECVSYWDELISDMREHGWRLFGWYVWDKQDGMAGDWNGRLAPAHEWVFHFNKISFKPNKVVHTKGAGQLGYKGNTGLRKADGTMGGWCHMGKPTQDFKIPDSVIRLQPQKNRRDKHIKAHPAVFPESLPKLLVGAYTNLGSVACDPFMGSGSTGVACAKLGRKFIGIELDETYFEIACERIQKAYDQPDLFVPQPEPPVQEDMEI
ncbi:MAG: site-specific DNA-methyltransferase [Planctomycetes bacterium]|nr:site-specific DNA-methyltransferase [Planctomycetota bacterium]